MILPNYEILAVVNLLVSFAICWSCICRLNSAVSRDFLITRARYALLLTGALANGLQPVLFGTWPAIGSVIFAGAVLLGLALNAVRWPVHGESCNRRPWAQGWQAAKAFVLRAVTRVRN